MKFEELPKFQKDFKKLKKRYLSLTKDLHEFERVISEIPLGNGKHFNMLAHGDSLSIVKARFFCRYLKGKSLRIIYAYFEAEDRIVFIQIYYKGDNESEDGERINQFIQTRKT